MITVWIFQIVSARPKESSCVLGIGPCCVYFPYRVFTFEWNTVKSDGSMLASNRAWRTFHWVSECPIDGKTVICDLLGTIARVLGGGPAVFQDIETDYCDNDSSTKKIAS